MTGTLKNRQRGVREGGGPRADIAESLNQQRRNRVAPGDPRGRLVRRLQTRPKKFSKDITTEGEGGKKALLGAEGSWVARGRRAPNFAKTKGKKKPRGGRSKQRG